MGKDSSAQGDKSYKLANDPIASGLAMDWVKQVIALASGVLAISAVFVTRSEGIPDWVILILVLSWAALFTSVVAGLEFIRHIVNYRLTQRKEYYWADWGSTGNKYALLCKFSFLAGLFVFAIFGIISIVSAQATPQSTTATPTAIVQPAPMVITTMPDQSPLCTPTVLFNPTETPSP